MDMGFLMYKRPHHQKMAGILNAMNPDFLRDTKCFFGGGTLITLLLGEYRESVDIDFLCADQDGYRKLRESIFNKGLTELFSGKVNTLRDVRADRDGVRAIFAADDGTPIKFEIAREARIDLDGTTMPDIIVPCLTKNDLFAEKLLANADRFGDKGAMSRDVIDLMVMENYWGQIPRQAWEKASGAYGDSAYAALRKAKEMLRDDPQYFGDCLEKMGIDGNTIGTKLWRSLGIDRSRPPGFGR